MTPAQALEDFRLNSIISEMTKAIIEAMNSFYSQTDSGKEYGLVSFNALANVICALTDGINVAEDANEYELKRMFIEDLGRTAKQKIESHWADKAMQERTDAGIVDVGDLQ
jgi:hypothetical protein